MAQVIKFYMPQGFNPAIHMVSAGQMGKLIEFPGVKITKSA